MSDLSIYSHYLVVYIVNRLFRVDICLLPLKHVFGATQLTVLPCLNLLTFSFFLNSFTS